LGPIFAWETGEVVVYDEWQLWEIEARFGVCVDDVETIWEAGVADDSCEAVEPLPLFEDAIFLIVEIKGFIFSKVGRMVTRTFLVLIIFLPVGVETKRVVQPF
jgi:hypothetical protein